MKEYLGEYINISEVHDTGKTKVWNVYDKNNLFTLAEIRWYGSWRKYCFYPQHGTIFDVKCLLEITNFITDRMNERKRPKP